MVELVTRQCHPTCIFLFRALFSGGYHWIVIFFPREGLNLIFSNLVCFRRPSFFRGEKPSHRISDTKRIGQIKNDGDPRCDFRGMILKVPFFAPRRHWCTTKESKISEIRRRKKVQSAGCKSASSHRTKRGPAFAGICSPGGDPETS